MKKLYEKEIELTMDNKMYSGEAIINFVSGNSSTTVVYPDQKTVELVEGQYEIQVYVHDDTEIKIAETTQEQCMDVPRTGLIGIIGLTEEKCFDITIPEQTISNALTAGGTEQYYTVESELESSSIIDINVQSLPTPKSIEDLQENYNLLENQDLDITFR
jgi:hypothetical protein